MWKAIFDSQNGVIDRNKNEKSFSCAGAQASLYVWILIYFSEAGIDAFTILMLNNDTFKYFKYRFYGQVSRYVI